MLWRGRCFSLSWCLPLVILSWWTMRRLPIESCILFWIISSLLEGSLWIGSGSIFFSARILPGLGTIPPALAWLNHILGLRSLSFIHILLNSSLCFEFFSIILWLLRVYRCHVNLQWDLWYVIIEMDHSLRLGLWSLFNCFNFLCILFELFLYSWCFLHLLLSSLLLFGFISQLWWVILWRSHFGWDCWLLPIDMISLESNSFTWLRSLLSISSWASLRLTLLSGWTGSLKVGLPILPLVHVQFVQLKRRNDPSDDVIWTLRRIHRSCRRIVLRWNWRSFRILELLILLWKVSSFLF